MKDKDITNAEAQGFAQLKWDAAEKGDIEAALEMQKAETESLCRLAKSRNAPQIESGDEWKNQA